MNTKILLVVTMLVNVMSAQVDIKIRDPKARLEITTPDNDSIPPVRLNLERKYQQIDYLSGRNVMIDKNGYLYRAEQLNIAKGIFNGQKVFAGGTGIQILEILRYTDLGSTVKFSFFTNYSLAPSGRATLHATINYGRAGGFSASDLAGGTSSPDLVGKISAVSSEVIIEGKIVHQLDLTFSGGGRGLRFMAKVDGANEVVITAEYINQGASVITSINIYDSLVTRFLR